MLKILSLKIFSITLSIVLLLSPIFSSRALAQGSWGQLAEPEVESGAALLMEADTGQIIYAKNIDNPMPPASITKMMTILLAFEALEQGLAEWDDVTTTSENAWRQTRGNVSQLFLNIGQEITYRELVEGISIVSANDACIVLAEFLSGSETSFVNRMNERAQELGMTNTRFSNSHGLTTEYDQHISARDIAVLAQTIINTQPEILEFDSRSEYTFNGIRQFNYNPLIGRYEGADGIKTGFTTAAGYNLAGTAEREGERYISVILNATTKQIRLAETEVLLDFGFRNFKVNKIYSPGDIVGEAEVRWGRQSKVPVTVNQELKVTVPRVSIDDLKTEIIFEEGLEAPLDAGTKVGTIVAYHADKALLELDLVTAEEVRKANIFVRAFRSIGNAFRNIGQTISRLLGGGSE